MTKETGRQANQPAGRSSTVLLILDVHGLGHVGIPTVHHTGVVACRDARVGVSHPARRRHDAVAVGNPGGVCRPKVMGRDILQARPVHRLVEVRATPRVVTKHTAPLPDKQQRVSALAHLGVQVRAQLPDQVSGKGKGALLM